MVDQLIALMGHSIESEEVKKLLVDWNVIYPRKVFCTEENPILKDKIEKHCVRLYFGIAGASPFLTRIPTGWEGGYIAQLVRIEFTTKRTYFITFDITTCFSSAFFNNKRAKTADIHVFAVAHSVTDFAEKLFKCN